MIKMLNDLFNRICLLLRKNVPSEDKCQVYMSFDVWLECLRFSKEYEDKRFYSYVLVNDSGYVLYSSELNYPRWFNIGQFFSYEITDITEDKANKSFILTVKKRC